MIFLRRPSILALVRRLTKILSASLFAALPPGLACADGESLRAAFRGDSPIRFNVTSLELDEGASTVIAVSLVSKPSGDVTIPLSAGDVDELEMEPSVVTFSPKDYDLPKNIRVFAKNDCENDGTAHTSIQAGAAESDDKRYDGEILTIPTTVNDSADSNPNITFLYESDLATSEVGTSAFFKVNISCAPTANVTVPLELSAEGEVILDRAELTFTPENFAVFQVVTVTGVSDCLSDGNKDFQVRTRNVVSDDARFNRYHDSLPIGGGEERKYTSVDGENADYVVTPKFVVDSGSGGLALELDYNAANHPDPFLVLDVALSCPIASDTYVSFKSTDNFMKVANSPDGHKFLTFKSSNYYKPQNVLVALDETVAASANFFLNKPYTVELFESNADDVAPVAVADSDFPKQTLNIALAVE